MILHGDAPLCTAVKLWLIVHRAKNSTTRVMMMMMMLIISNKINQADLLAYGVYVSVFCTCMFAVCRILRIHHYHVNGVKTNVCSAQYIQQNWRFVPLLCCGERLFFYYMCGSILYMSALLCLSAAFDMFWHSQCMSVNRRQMCGLVN